MGCILRVFGRKFNVDRFLAGTTLRPYGAHHVGDSFSSGSGKFTDNGMAIDLSKRMKVDGRQFSQVTAYLIRHKKELLALQHTRGVETMEVNFLVPHSPKNLAQIVSIPPTLIAIAGTLGLSITLTFALTSDMP